MEALRIIVCPHELAMGGSQINAIELAAQLKSRGHDVLVFAPDGQLGSRVVELGLEHVVSPSGTKPTLQWMHALGRISKSWRADLVHTYEWGPSLGAVCRLIPFTDVRLLMTVLSMDVPGFLPKRVPLIVGTEQLRQSILPRNAPVYLMEPPIDTRYNSLEAVERGDAAFSMDDEVVVSMVCRMTDELDKAAGVLQAIEAVERLSWKYRIRLVLAGDGEAMARVLDAATQVNRTLGREAITVLGNLNDPRNVYADCDISLGMGSSAIKALAFRKPLIVQGAHGYWKILTPDTLHEFSWLGFYGDGGSGVSALVEALDELCAQASEREKLGRWGLALVEDRFSLDSASEHLERIYRQTCQSRIDNGKGTLDMVRSIYDYFKFLFNIKVIARLTP